MAAQWLLNWCVCGKDPSISSLYVALPEPLLRLLRVSWCGGSQAQAPPPASKVLCLTSFPLWTVWVGSHDHMTMRSALGISPLPRRPQPATAPYGWPPSHAPPPRRLQIVFGNIPAVPVAPEEERHLAVAAEQFAPALHALRATPRVVVAFVLIYVGAAPVIRTQPLRLSRDLTALSGVDLCEWSVLNGSGLATSFAAYVAHAAPARQAALVEHPWWLVAPTVTASFDQLRQRAVNDRPGCPAGSTVKYLVTFPSVAAGAFRDTPGLCGQLQTVSLGPRYPGVSFNAGMVFTAAGHSGALLPDAAAAVRLRGMVTELNRRLRLELRDPTVIRQGPVALEAICPTAASRVGLEHLTLPAVLGVGLPLLAAAVLAVVVPAACAVVAANPRGGCRAVDPPGGGGGRLPEWTADAQGGGAAVASTAAPPAALPPPLPPPPPLPGSVIASPAGRWGATPVDAGMV